MHVPPAALVDTRHQYTRLFDVYVPIALAVLGVIVIAVVVLVLRARRRAPQGASRRHENHALEGTYAGLLALTVAGLLYLTFSAEHQVDTVANREHPALTIHVIGSQWEWTFVYPGYHVTIRSGTTGRRTFVVPTGEPVRFALTSVDVIHSFWISALDYKHDLIPGMTQYQTLTFSRPGLFHGQCAEFCGLRHADMLFSVRAVSPGRFRAWATAAGRAGA